VTVTLIKRHIPQYFSLIHICERFFDQPVDYRVQCLAFVGALRQRLAINRELAVGAGAALQDLAGDLDLGQAPRACASLCTMSRISSSRSA
jgi:hypothetical protein